MFRTYILNFALRISGEKKTVNKVRFVFYCQLVQAIGRNPKSWKMGVLCWKEQVPSC
jgi:hypothetical protein